VIKHGRFALWAVLGAGAALALGVAAIASAAAPAPKLVSPKGKVAPGRIRLVVKDPAASKAYPVYVQIERHRKLDKYGHLKRCTNSSKGCDFTQLDRGAHGVWSLKVAAESFPGWWATTPGKYYWNAEHVDCGFKGCEDVSTIGSFIVK
jgi:hypothetical protein